MRSLIKLACASALVLTSCSSLPTQEVPLLATGRITSDFASYSIRRVGLLPIRTDGEDGAVDGDLEQSFHAELVAATGYEVIKLSQHDLLECDALQPYRRGSYSAETLLELRRRFLLDAVAVGVVSNRRVVPPQRLGAQFDLISCETGATLWSSRILLDAADVKTRDALVIWSEDHTDTIDGAELVLLSPRRFARFAAWQVMQLL
jgi:hypothetical protein